MAVSHRGAWRDLPERLGNWNTICKNFDRWSKAGVWARVSEQVQAMAHQGGDVSRGGLTTKTHLVADGRGGGRWRSS